MMLGRFSSVALSLILAVSLTTQAPLRVEAFSAPRHATSLRSSSSATALDAAKDGNSIFVSLGHAFATAALASTLALHPLPALADGQTKDFKLPPIDFSNKSRCVFSSSKMGQANAARDSLYDLRECKLSGANANEFDLSGVIMSKTDVSGAKFREAQFSKGYLRDSNFDGADFTNAIVDRASFKGSSLKGTIFQNAVLTATSFEGATSRMLISQIPILVILMSKICAETQRSKVKTQ